MVYEVYIDSIFLMNFVLNMYLLALTAKSLNRTATRIRIMVGAAAGGLAYCIILVMPLPYLGKIMIGLIPVGMGICKLTFKTHGFGNLLRETIYMFGYALVLGGAMLFLLRQFSFLGRHSETVWGVLGIGYISYAALSYGGQKFRERQHDPICQVIIPCGGKKVRFRALIDTGNGLTEPVSGKPVSILEQTAWEEIKPLMREEKLKMIPYHSVGSAHGLMKGYEIAAMIVEREGHEKCYERVILGICQEQISAGGQYQMILHPEIN